MDANAVALAIRQLAFAESLTQQQSADAFGVIMRGEATPVQVAALLTALRVKGESAAEVAGAARALRDAMVRVPSESPEELVDTCGTGGGTVGTFNVSTAAGLLAAGLGVRVAKHGNRSFTSQCGSADVLEALGVPLDAPVERLSQVLAACGIVFMFAPAMHPAMRYVGPVRRELAIPTVMNLVGPLANPAGAGRQVVGVADRSRVRLVAGALHALGSKHALVVHGDPGMDEVSPLGPTHVAEIRDGTMHEWTIDPGDYGFTGGTAAELRGGAPRENADLIRALLSGGGNSVAQAAVILNAAAALYVAERRRTFATCVSVAQTALATGIGLEVLDRMVAAYLS